MRDRGRTHPLHRLLHGVGHGRGDPLLHRDDAAAAKPEVVDDLIELCHVALAQQKPAGQQRTHSVQPRAEAAVAHTLRQRTDRDPAAGRTLQLMSAILRHIDARFWKVADLMPPRLRILVSQGVVACAAAVRLAVDHMVNLFDRKQRPTPTRMAAATATSPLHLASTLRAGNPGTIGRRWLRRVAGVAAESLLELPNPCFQAPDLAVGSPFPCPCLLQRRRLALDRRQLPRTDPLQVAYAIVEV
jgi:hypothetical protein